LITCGHCEYCLSGRQNLCSLRDLISMYRAGAFAEQIAIPERNLIPLPADMSSAGVALTEPGATGLHAVLLGERVASRPVSEARALVIGAGSVGLLTALILKDKGAHRAEIAETNPLRRTLIFQHCDLEIFDPLTSSVETGCYDLVLDAVGNAATRNAAVSAAKSGAVIVHIGLMDSQGSLDVRAMTLREITFIGSYTYTPVDMQMTLQKLYSGALGAPDWVEQRPLSQGSAAFKDLLKGQCAAPKIVLNTGL